MLRGIGEWIWWWARFRGLSELLSAFSAELLPWLVLRLAGGADERELGAAMSAEASAGSESARRACSRAVSAMTSVNAFNPTFFSAMAARHDSVAASDVIARVRHARANSSIVMQSTLR